MNQNSFDLLSQVSFPDWMIEDIDNLQDPLFQLESNKIVSKPNEAEILQKNSVQVQMKRRNPVSYQIGYQTKKYTHQNFQGEQQGEQQSQKQSSEMKNKNKQERRCQIAKKYRQKKKQYLKSIEQQNRFLKFKVDQLSFRLRQLEMQINKLRNNDQSQTQPYQILKSQCMKQIQQGLSQHSLDKDDQQCLKMAERLKSFLGFDGKEKLDLLNYFMSQLLENVVSDRVFYFIDTMLSKTGIHRHSNEVPLRRIDIEVIQILKLNDPQRAASVKKRQIQNMHGEAQKFKKLWKKMYQVYLAILNQGFKMQRIVETIQKDFLKIVNICDLLKLQVFFQKNKQRMDIRQMRSSWFKELQKQNTSDKICNQKSQSKRIKAQN